MGTVWYAVRRDRRDVFDLGKVGFWIADALGLSNDLPKPPISAPVLASLSDAFERAYGDGAQDVMQRLGAYLSESSGAVIADEQWVWDEYHDGTDNTPIEVDTYWRMP